MIEDALREEVLETAILLRKYGVVWMKGGAVCARNPTTNHVVVTPSGLDYHELTPKDMIVTDMDLNVVDGEHRPSVALNLWTAILDARPDVHALVHTHSPYATAFSVTNDPIPVITETQADWFGGSVRIARYAHIEDPHFVTAPVEALGDGFGVLLGQHGPITVGSTLDDALERCVTLEEAAKTYFVAHSIGSPVVFSEAQAQRSFDYYHSRYGQPSDEN